MDSSKTKTNHLDDALKSLNSAIEEWDKISNKNASEQELSPESAREGIDKSTQELLQKLQEQISDLSRE